MTCSQLLHLHHMLDRKDIHNLDTITALIDNDFPVDKWEKDGSLESMVEWANSQYETYYNKDYERRDIDDFLYCVADVALRDGLDLEYPMNVDMDKVYDLLEEMN